MHAVILAGGLGRRLRPYTMVFPKPLVPVGEKPILEILLRQLKRHGFTTATLAVGYLAELIQAYFGHGEKLGMEIRYAHEDEPLGTAGPLRALADDLPEHFLCVNGDVLTDLDFGAFMRHHKDSGGMGTVSLYERNVHIDFGVVHVREDGKLDRWEEKPRLHYRVSMGAYALTRDALDHLPKTGPMDMPDLLVSLAATERGVGSFRHDGYWLDIGRPDDYEQANEPEVLATLLRASGLAE